MLSTYARLFIGLSPTISGLVIDSARKNPNRATNVLKITMLSPDQIDQSLKDPRNKSLKTLIQSVYANNIKAGRTIIKSQDTLGEQRVFIEQALNTLSSKSKKSTPAQKKEIQNATNNLNQRYKLLNNIDNASTHTDQQLTNIQSEADTLSVNNNKEWVNYSTKHLEEIKGGIEKVLSNARLPSLLEIGEVTNFLRQDSWQEVLDRFNDSGASKDLEQAGMEKLLGLKKPSYDTYFKLKAYMALRAVDPSREKIGQCFSQLKSYFEQANQEASDLTAKQEAQIHSLDKEVQPILKLTESNNETLNANNFEHMLGGVISKSALESIKENTRAQISEVPPVEKPTPQAPKSEVSPEEPTPKLPAA